MIYLYTGAPGSGKTLKMLSDWLASADGSRPIYVFGVEGLVSSDKWVTLDDPSTWHSLPEGSIVLVDEAQRAFRPRRPGDPVPPHISAAETHRHSGIDLVMTTQHPMMIDAHLRRLCSSHEHLVNVWGMKSRSTVYAWDECQDDPKDRSSRRTARKSIFKYPKAVFSLYKSAQLHTKKPRVPAWFKFGLPVLLFVIVGALFFLYRTLNGLGGHSRSSRPTVFGATPSPSASSSGVLLASDSDSGGSRFYRHPLEHFQRISLSVRNHQAEQLPRISSSFRVAGFIEVSGRRRYVITGPNGSFHTVSVSACEVLDGLRVCRWGGGYVSDRPASASFDVGAPPSMPSPSKVAPIGHAVATAASSVPSL